MQEVPLTRDMALGVRIRTTEATMVPRRRSQAIVGGESREDRRGQGQQKRSATEETPGDRGRKQR